MQLNHLRELKDYIESIKLELTGDFLELEIEDETIGKIVNAALVEIQRYTNEFRLYETDFKECVDLSQIPCYAVTNVYRTYSTTSVDNNSGLTDPMYMQFWTSFGLGTIYNLNQYLLNFASYNTLQQIRNTMSTDLAFKEDKDANKLYINISTGNPGRIVIEFIPVYNDVSEVKDEYWKDMLRRLALAKTKIILGRLRTSVKHNNSQITLDGDVILAEGKEELTKLEDELEANNDYFLPID